MDNEIKSFPMVALRGMTILPEMVVHFDVSRERSIAAIQEAMAEDISGHTEISGDGGTGTERCL